MLSDTARHAGSMKTNTRYIITTAGVAAGLFAIGATASALSSDNTATSDPLGVGVVLPSASVDPSASTGPSASPSLVEVEYAENEESTLPPVDPIVLDDTGWSTGPATGPGSVDDDHDDDGDDHDDDGDDHDDDHEDEGDDD